LFAGSWKITRFYIRNVMAYRSTDLLVEVEVAPQKSRVKLVGNTQHIMHHQYLSVYPTTSTDADDGYRQRCGHFTGQGSGDFFEYDGKASRFLKGMCVAFESLRLLLPPGAHTVGAKFINRLRGETEVTHHRNPRSENEFDRFQHLRATFEFYGMGARLLHDSDGAL